MGGKYVHSWKKICGVMLALSLAMGMTAISSYAATRKKINSVTVDITARIDQHKPFFETAADHASHRHTAFQSLHQPFSTSFLYYIIFFHKRIQSCLQISTDFFYMFYQIKLFK